MGTRRTDVKSRFYNRDNPANGGKEGDQGEGQVSIGLGQGQNRYHQVRSGLSCRYVGPSSSRIDLHCGRAAATMSWDTGECDGGEGRL